MSALDFPLSPNKGSSILVVSGGEPRHQRRITFDATRNRSGASSKTTSPSEGVILTIKQVADYLKVTERTIYCLAGTEKIPAFKVGGTWRFSRADIDAWIKQQSRWKATRQVLAWRLANTRTGDFCTAALTEAPARDGTADIFNTDQGSQFTRAEFTDVLKAHGVPISMDGRGRCHDNRFVERWRKTVQHERVYRRLCENGSEQKKLGCVFRRVQPPPTASFAELADAGRDLRRCLGQRAVAGSLKCTDEALWIGRQPATPLPA